LWDIVEDGEFRCSAAGKMPRRRSGAAQVTSSSRYSLLSHFHVVFIH
jgi:hypothetical protein